MAHDNSIDTDVILDTDRRFEIFVPSPKARINLGASNLTEKDEGPFGYTGISIQSDVHLFIDANKHTLFQTGQNYCGQVGGKWLQYSNSDMFLSCTSSANLSADKKVLIASGAGQGQITAIDHGASPRVVAYNSLELHYRVDRIQSSIFEFFHGRREKNPRSALSKKGGVDEAYFGSKATTKLALADLQGGFLKNATNSLRELLPPGAAKRADDKWGELVADGDPVDWIDPLILSKVAPKSDDPTSLEYGASAYLKRFDPYAKTDPATLKPWGAALAKFKNFLAAMRRFNDVVYKYALLITDNFLVKRAIAAMEAVDNLAKATSAGYNLTRNVMGFWLKDGDTGAGGNSGRDAPLGGRFADEALSGVGARFGGSDPTKDADAARQAVKGDKAKITSVAGNFDLSSRDADQWTITIEAEYFSADDGGTGGKKTTTVTLAALAAAAEEPKKAVLTVTASAEVVTPKIKVQVSPAAGGAGNAELVAWAGELLGVPVDEMSAIGSGHIVRPGHATVIEWIRDPTTLADETRDFDVAGTPTTVRFGDRITLTRSDESRAVRIAVDGADVTVTFDSSAIDYATDASAAASVRGAFATAVGSAGLVRPLVGSSFKIKTLATGSAARILIVDGDAPALTALGLSSGQEVTGRDIVPAVVTDLRSVSAAQLVTLLGSVDGVTVTEDSGKVVLESTYEATADHDSKVTVSGNLGTHVFTETTKTEKVEGDKLNRAKAQGGQAGYKSLISWNHELQKLPEDTRNLVRPLRDAISDATAALSGLEAAAESATAIVSGEATGLPGPPEAIGLIAKEGITLGTSDRIVGTGGQGIVFIADGDSGTENHERFIKKHIESFVNVALAFDPIDKLFAGDDPPAHLKKPPSLGFRVYSDSATDLYGTYSAQLLALGRGKVKAATLRDGKTMVGIGVARIAGSHGVEVAGYRHVVIDARSKGEAATEDDGGRVDVLGQTIFVGGFKDGTLEDFKDDKTGLGLRPLEIDALGGGEHWDDNDIQDNLAAQVKSMGWTKEMRENHPNTNFVRIHSAKETTMVVGSYELHFTEAEGFALGTRKAGQLDPTKNVFDDTKAHFVLDHDKAALVQAKDAAGLFIEATKVQLQQVKDGAQLLLEATKATLMAEDGGSAIELSADQVAIANKSGNGFLVKGGKASVIADQVLIKGQKLTLL